MNYFEIILHAKHHTFHGKGEEKKKIPGKTSYRKCHKTLYYSSPYLWLIQMTFSSWLLWI